MYTNTTRITGLSGSGIDTDSMVEKLMHAESAKLYRYQRNVQWKTWQQEAYRGIITKLQDFQNKWFGAASSSTNLKYSLAFSSFKNSVKSSKGGESEAITINRSTSSQKYEISVEQLAQSDTYVGSVSKGKKFEGEADMSGILAKLNKGENIEINVALDGKAKKITLTKADFDAAAGSSDTEKLKNFFNDKLDSLFGKEDGKSKVSVSFASDGKFSVNTILGHSVSMSASGTSSDSIYTSSGKAEDFKNAEGSFKIKAEDGLEYVVTIDANTKGDSIAAKINNAIADMKDSKGKKLSDQISASVNKDGNLVISSKSADKNIEISNVSGGLTGIMDNVTLKTTNDLKNYFGIKSGSNTAGKTTSLEDIFGGSAWEDGGIWDASGKASITINGTTVSFTKDTNLATFMQNINSSDAGVTVSYNTTNQKFTITSSDSGAVNEIKFGTDSGIDASTERVLASMGFSVAGGKIADEAVVDGKTVKQHTQKAQDAVLTIDGVRTTRTSNTIDLDGMNITLNKETDADETITLGNETDVDAIYENISKFVEEYNTLIGDLNKQVKENRAKSDDYSHYEPLTDQEKKEMEDDEIKLWEEKAKTGLVYRDSTVTGILSKMRSVLYSSVTKVDGSKISLYNFGITTSSDYLDNGKLVIDEDKLKEAISNNLDDIQSIFTGSGTTGKGIADKLDEIVKSAVGIDGSLREKAGIAGTSSANENTLSKQIKEINERISLEKERLVAKENKYYSMFSMMESSILNSNSQMDSLLSMLG